VIGCRPLEAVLVQNNTSNGRVSDPQRPEKPASGPGTVVHLAEGSHVFNSEAGREPLIHAAPRFLAARLFRFHFGTGRRLNNRNSRWSHTEIQGASRQ
jgi:hypothetical protein